MLQKLAIAACLAAGASVGHADVLGARIGAYQWHQNYDGTVRSGNVNIDLKNDLGFDNENGSVYYIAIDHPIPVLPNILVQHTELSSTSTARLNRTIDFDGITYGGSTAVRSELDLSHTDATFYYRPLDNWVKLKLGLTVRKFDNGVKIRSLDTGEHSSVDINVVLPMVFAGAQFDLPLTGLYVGGDINAIAYGDGHLYDGRVYAGYESPIGLGGELGYRRFDFKYDHNGDHADATIDGAYLSLFFHF